MWEVIFHGLSLAVEGDVLNLCVEGMGEEPNRHVCMLPDEAESVARKLLSAVARARGSKEVTNPRKARVVGWQERRKGGSPTVRVEPPKPEAPKQETKPKPPKTKELLF